VAGTALALVRGLLARPLAAYYVLVSSAGLLLLIGLAMVFSATSVALFGASG
jgi:cell division protein FtsW